MAGSQAQHYGDSAVADPGEVKRLRARLLRLLSRREYSLHELRNRLGAPSRKDGSVACPVAIEEALDWAVSCDLQSDERFAESLIRRSSQRHGLSRIKLQLKANHIDPQLVERLVDGLHESERHRAFALWENRFGVLPETDKEKARQFRFLLSRGFKHETVLRILRGAVD
tara:strand:- start:192 stop:701 length:510 start_codon:yes stop_codon:yes gene_type:complete